LTDFFLPLLMTSSVLMVTSSRDDSSMTMRAPGGTSVKAKATILVGGRLDSLITILTLTPREEPC